MDQRLKTELTAPLIDPPSTLTLHDGSWICFWGQSGGVQRLTSSINDESAEFLLSCKHMGGGGAQGSAGPRRTKWLSVAGCDRGSHLQSQNTNLANTVLANRVVQGYCLLGLRP